MLDHQLYGFNPWGFHLTNVLIHAVNTVLVFLVLRRMTGATWRSVVVAGLFGLHPLRVESVAWISERKDVLSVMFWMLTLWAYVRYVQGCEGVEHRELSTSNGCLRPLTFNYFLALLFFFLSLMSKPMVVTLPCVLLLLDYWPLECWKQKSLRDLLAEKTPFFLLSAIVSAVTYAAQKNAGMMNAGLTGLSLSFDARLENALVSYGRYLGKLFWPADLCALYPYPAYWPMPTVLSAGLLVLGLSVFMFLTRRQWPFLLTGWLWYLGTLVPVLGLISVGPQAMADRYSYLPSIGILIALVWGVHQLTKGWAVQFIILGAAGVAALLVCLGLTRHQISYWRDEVSLWHRAVTVTENNYGAHNWLGCAFCAQGRSDEAIDEFQTVIKLNLNFAGAYCSLGKILFFQGHVDDAIDCYQKALTVQPNSVVALNNLGNILLKTGQVDAAISLCQKAIEIEPDNAAAQETLGFAFQLQGNLSEALAHFRKAQELQPDNGTAEKNLGYVLLRLRRLDEAIGHFTAALQFQPDSAESHDGLGNALLANGAPVEAIREFREAAKLLPSGAEIHCSLGYALAKQGQLDEAIHEFQEAIRLKPGFAEASNDLVVAVGMKEKSIKPPGSATKP